MNPPQRATPIWGCPSGSEAVARAYGPRIEPEWGILRVAKPRFLPSSATPADQYQIRGEIVAVCLFHPSLRCTSEIGASIARFDARPFTLGDDLLAFGRVVPNLILCVQSVGSWVGMVESPRDETNSGQTNKLQP